MPEPAGSAPPSLPGRQELLGTITTPLIFFALALLIVEASLAVVLVSGRLAESHIFFLVLVMAFLFLVVVLIVTFLTYKVPKHLMARLDEVVSRKVAGKLTDFYRSQVVLNLKRLRHELAGFNKKGPVDLLQPSLRTPGLSQNPFSVYVKPTLEKLLGDAMLSHYLPSTLRDEFLEALASPPDTIADIQKLLDKSVKALEQGGEVQE
jgi:hypothetical protein